MNNQDITDVLLSAAFYKDTDRKEVVCKICAIAMPMVPARIRVHLLYHGTQGYTYNPQTNEMELRA